ncbi:uncharacterized protein isoform X1 [Leptinotarsa decemlineata]|uniref:uncharacterized protein isoform X1 n=1 Tax=Leptinotarsa decemlineata TaxID=7539 RepID=UPI003D307359
MVRMVEKFRINLFTQDSSMLLSLSLSTANGTEIHIFCDSSEEAFAVVAYLRIIFETHIEVSFVSAKARVSPLKPISIPRLELQAAVMGSRLLCTILKEIDFPVDSSFLWTVSKTVLCWIKGDGRNYKQFVAHRIGEIQDLTVATQWKYVPGKLNVADEATRINSSSIDANYNNCWFRGPDFLWNLNDPPPDFDFSNYHLDDENERKSAEHFVGFVVPSFDYLPEVYRFSKKQRLVRSAAWVLRFCRLLLGKHHGKTDISSGELTIQEIDDAKRLCLKRSQEESFGKEIELLKAKVQLDRENSLFDLSAFINDDKLLKMQTRISQALCLGEPVKKPVILDPKNATVDLILQHFHEKNHHQGKELVLNNIRQEYWLIKGRQAVKNIFYRCCYCKLKKSKPNIPKMGDLPLMRLTPGLKPFASTDYYTIILIISGPCMSQLEGIKKNVGEFFLLV